MTHSSFRSASAVAALIVLSVAGCRKASHSTDNQVASLLFDVSSPAAREALATPVDFRLTDENYEQWERAQRFLEALPRSAFAVAPAGGGNPIDNAVATLESSPRARTAIERTGLSVRDFVLETIALAQAMEAESGQPASGLNVPAENVQFIQRYRSRIVQARAAARATAVPPDDYGDPDTASTGVQAPIDVAPADPQESAVPTTDSANVGAQVRESDSVRRDGQEGERPRHPATDTVRDTIPNL
ncbi:MAG TPA: hypothetical protein VJ825_11800 [Gemmatimonadaceae bacterium]|nr:hypothetical protein [Gemmatimonadaceae bacterium]